MDYIIWSDTRKAYKNYDDSVRYIQFFLYNRLIHMAEMLENKTPLPSLSTTNGKTHSVQFISPYMENTVLLVADGALISENEVPFYDKNESHWEKQGLHYINFSSFRPIYEDTVFELKEGS